MRSTLFSARHFALVVIACAGLSCDREQSTTVSVDHVPRVLSFTVPSNEAVRFQVDVPTALSHPVSATLRNDGPATFHLSVGQESIHAMGNASPTTILVGDYPRAIRLEGALWEQGAFDRLFRHGLSVEASRVAGTDQFLVLIHRGRMVDFSPSRAVFGLCGYEGIEAARSNDRLTRLSGIHSLTGTNQPEPCRVPPSLARPRLLELSRSTDTQEQAAAAHALTTLPPERG